MDHGQLKLGEEKESLRKHFEKEGCRTLEDIFLKLTGTALRDEEA